MGGADKFNKVGDRTMNKRIEFEEDKEKVEGAVIGCGGDEVSIILFVSPYRSFNVLFLLLNLITLSCLSILEHTTFKIIPRKRG